MSKLSFVELQSLIISWAKDKNLVNPENAPKQRLKLLEEIGETAKAFLNNNESEIKDGIGDIFVVLIILHEQLGTGFNFKENVFLEKAEDLDVTERLYNIIYYDDCFSFENLCYLCFETGYDMLECANIAWNEIKNRKGKTVNGTFIKG